MIAASLPTTRQLLVTMTGEPLQPIRLYYDVPNKASVARVFAALLCTVKENEGWNWQDEHEAGALEFARPRAELPPEVHPIILGHFRFSSNDAMVLAVRSADRAVAAAKFFAPLFGPKIVLRRARVLNRLLDASENAHGLDRIDRLLDQSVVRIDPAEAEAEIEAAIAGGQTPEEKLTAFSEHAAERRKRDVPLVEDFPLWPEEETADFRDLTMMLQLRTLRAYEHWKGNHLTLAEIIHIVVEKNGRGLSVALPR